MEAKECKIQDILTENKKYIIPSYQRPYSWQLEHVEQLLEDITHSHESEENEYFIGSMICINKGGNTYEVVDGQQRLTTLSLILLQIKNMVQHEGVKDDLQKRILPIDVYSDESSEPRLIVRKKEFHFYTQFILKSEIEYKPEKPTDTEKRFIENNKLIKEYLEKFLENHLKKMAKYILQNIYIVFVTTEDISSSFRLFNVLNNRGLSLTHADLLKNTLFESASKSNNYNKSNTVEQFWLEIEDLIGIKKLDKFLTLNKASEKSDRNRVLNKGINAYTNSLIDDFNNDAIKMSMALLHSAKNYIKITDNDFEDLRIKKIIELLLTVHADEWIPPVLAFLNRMTRNKDLEKEDFYEFIFLFEKVYIHGWIKRQTKSKRESVCYSALVAINSGLSIGRIKDYMLVHADNQGLLECLDRDIYAPIKSQINLVKAILLRIDRELQDSSVIKTYTGRITVEHILPQKLKNTYWTERFSHSEHEQWLHKLGNLTLISGSKNSEAQNSDFLKKKVVYEKLNNKTSFDITRDICRNNDWNILALKKRHNSLKNILASMWQV